MKSPLMESKQIWLDWYMDTGSLQVKFQSYIQAHPFYSGPHWILIVYPLALMLGSKADGENFY